MKHAILIQVHKNPEQLKMLVDSLNHPELDIFVNVDSKFSEVPFKDLLSKDVKFIKNRTAVYWADWSQIEATLAALREIVDFPESYGHISFISGQDYPIISADKLVEILNSEPEKEYMQWQEVSPEGWDISHRYENYHYSRPQNYWPMKILTKLKNITLPKRKHPLSRVYGGSSWFTITQNAVEFILNYSDENRWFLEFHKPAKYCDELFFQTILLNSPLSKSVVNCNYRYIDWSEKRENPKILTSSDYNAITVSNCWFARKFDPSIDSNIIDMLEQFRNSTLEKK